MAHLVFIGDRHGALTVEALGGSDQMLACRCKCGADIGVHVDDFWKIARRCRHGHLVNEAKTPGSKRQGAPKEEPRLTPAERAARSASAATATRDGVKSLFLRPRGEGSLYSTNEHDQVNEWKPIPKKNNLLRRHLDLSQRAMAAARLATMPRGARTDLVAPDALDQKAAARLMSVSQRGVSRASTVIVNGAPEIVAAVDAGKVTVSDAAAVSKLTRVEQVEALAKVESGTARTLSETALILAKRRCLTRRPNSRAGWNDRRKNARRIIRELEEALVRICEIATTADDAGSALSKIAAAIPPRLKNGDDAEVPRT